MVAIALRRAVAILGLGLLAAVHASAQSVRTIPAQPRAQEDFLVVYGVGIGVPQRMFSSRATTTAPSPCRKARRRTRTCLSARTRSPPWSS